MAKKNIQKALGQVAVLSVFLAAFSCMACSWSASGGDLKKAETKVSADNANGDKIPLRILYAGNSWSGRERDFTGFLRRHFKEVATEDLEDFRDKAADGFDVVIMDYDGDGFKAPQPKLSETYSRPTVTVGVQGARLGGRLGLKTGYL